MVNTNRIPASEFVNPEGVPLKTPLYSGCALCGCLVIPFFIVSFLSHSSQLLMLFALSIIGLASAAALDEIVDGRESSSIEEVQSVDDQLSVPDLDFDHVELPAKKVKDERRAAALLQTTSVVRFSNQLLDAPPAAAPLAAAELFPMAPHARDASFCFCENFD